VIAGRLVWYSTLLAGVVPVLLLGFLASGFADRPMFALWGIVLALVYALLLRRGLGAGWGGWVTGGRCLLLLAFGAALWSRLVVRYGEELDLGLRAVVPGMRLEAVARPQSAFAAVTTLAVAARRHPDRPRLPLGEEMRIALGRVAHARSGDKGEASNVGLIADCRRSTRCCGAR
jgi:hypothetical protein